MWSCPDRCVQECGRVQIGVSGTLIVSKSLCVSGAADLQIDRSRIRWNQFGILGQMTGHAILRDTDLLDNVYGALKCNVRSTSPAAERIWKVQGSRGRVLALAFR